VPVPVTLFPTRGTFWLPVSLVPRFVVYLHLDHGRCLSGCRLWDARAASSVANDVGTGVAGRTYYRFPHPPLLTFTCGSVVVTHSHTHLDVLVLHGGRLQFTTRTGYPHAGSRIYPHTTRPAHTRYTPLHGTHTRFYHWPTTHWFPPHTCGLPSRFRSTCTPQFYHTVHSDSSVLHAHTRTFHTTRYTHTHIALYIRTVTGTTTVLPPGRDCPGFLPLRTRFPDLTPRPSYSTGPVTFVLVTFTHTRARTTTRFHWFLVYWDTLCYYTVTVGWFFYLIHTVVVRF